jgi:hypothetical protein
MKPILFLVGVLAAAVLTASAQETKPLPPRTIREAIAVPGTPSASPETNGDGHPQAQPTNLFFCPPKTCLYYSGDFDSNNTNWNALLDMNNPGINADGEVWVGVKPTKGAIVTGTSGNFATNATSVGINPTPFAIRTGITSGQGGRLLCKTAGNAIVKAYGSCNIGVNCYNYNIRKLKKSCTLAKGKVYFVLMQPQYNDGSTVDYLWDDDGAHANKRGWPEITDHSYFTSISFHRNYEPTWGSSGACGGIGCSGFSISLTGTKK